MMLLPSAGPSRAGYHRIATWLACPQRYAYAHVLKLQPVREAEGRALGSLLHIARMHYYLGRAKREGARDPVEAMRTAPARIAWTFARAARLWPRYVEWAARHDDFTILDVEREYELLAAGQLFTARIDLVFARGGKVWAEDFKTGSGATARIAEQYDMAGQMAMITVIGNAVLRPMYANLAPAGFGGIVITGFGTADQEPAVWRDVLHLPNEWPTRVTSTVIHTAREIAEGTSWDPWHYPVNPEACKGDRWGPCPYLALCQRGKVAAGEYDVAADAATAIREGSGR